jgi:CRISPR system Cascade subunit CasC
MKKNATVQVDQPKFTQAEVKPKLVEIHVLQNHVPANMNRDDLGAPKTAVFGGVLRARISSQCLKRSVRWSGEHFRHELKDHLGVRTRTFPDLVAKALADATVDKKERDAIVKQAESIAKSQDKGDEDTAEAAASDGADAAQDSGSEKTQLIFLGPNEAQKFVQTLLQLRELPQMKEAYGRFLEDGLGKKPTDFSKALAAAYRCNPGVDVALYGRMTTSTAFDNVDAAMSVAHAISTHEVIPDTDYWTGVDDIKSREKEGGAGHIAEALFGSATFYKYASLDWPALLRNLNLNDDRELAYATVKCFLNAFFRETPSGKRHSYAHNNCPNAILVEIRDRNTPFNYANAFVRPVERATGTDIVFESAQKLAFYVEQVEQTFAGKPRKGFWLWMPNAEGETVEIKGRETPDPKGDGQTRVDALVEAVLAELRAEV